MKTTAVHLREVCSKKAKFASCVENPPIEIVEKGMTNRVKPRHAEYFV